MNRHHVPQEGDVTVLPGERMAGAVEVQVTAVVRRLRELMSSAKKSS
jgi:hypothetical protein